MDTELSLETFLSDEKLCSTFTAEDVLMVKTLRNYLRNPAGYKLLFLEDKVFNLDLKSDHTNHLSTDTVHLEIQHIGPKTTPTRKFKLEVMSVSGFQLEFLACSNDVIMAQIETESRKGVCQTQTLLLSLNDDVEVKEVPDLHNIDQACGCPQGGSFIYVDSFRPSFMHMLDYTTDEQKIFQVAKMGQWVSKLCVSISPNDSARFVALIVSDGKQSRKTVKDGVLMQYDVLQDRIVAVADEYILSTEILKFSPDGRHVIAASQQPCAIHIFQSGSLHVLYTASYPQYCPFIDLPFLLPVKLSLLQEQESLLSLPVCKTIVRSHGLKGLTLLESKVYFLFSVLSRDVTTLAILHLNVDDPLENSKVDLRELVGD